MIDQDKLDKTMKALLSSGKPEKEVRLPPMTKENLNRRFRMRLRNGKPVMEEVK